jgi:8-oxo-dGTP pyrophosphatase MutT (NUDIX family)
MRFTTAERVKWMGVQHRRMSSSAVMLENDRGELLIVKTNYKPYWTLPGGIVDENETPKQAAIREVKEELGLDIDAAELEFIAVVDRISDVMQTYQFLFKTKLHSESMSFVLQESEIDEYDFVNKLQVVSNDRNYAKAIYHWANGKMGYVEQILEEEE